jgi:hypothetical protein
VSTWLSCTTALKAGLHGKESSQKKGTYANTNGSILRKAKANFPRFQKLVFSTLLLSFPVESGVSLLTNCPAQS